MKNKVIMLALAVSMGISATMPAFAADNLGGEAWGLEGSREAMAALGTLYQGELDAAGISTGGQSPITIDGKSITYATDNRTNVKLKLVKEGDYYELYDYGTIDSTMEGVLLAMCHMISSTPQTIYDAIYTAAEYDQRVMTRDEYTNFGDGKVMYSIHDGYVVFKIKAK